MSQQEARRIPSDFPTFVFDLTWKGHEYLDAIRDPKIWKKTKASANKAGGAGFDFIVEIAKAFGRKALMDAGIPLA